MTICIPKKPFIIFGKVLLWCGLLSWIPGISFITYFAFAEERMDYLVLNLIWIIPMLFTILNLIDINEKKHWFKWCEK